MSDPAFLDYGKERPFRIKYLRDGSPLTSELTVTRVNSLAVLCKTKRGAAVLIDADDILEMEEIVPEVAIPKLAIRQLGAVTHETVRQHLADRHGVDIGAVPDDSMAAMEWHTRQHDQMMLSHRHPATQFTPVSREEIERRTEELDREYENALECKSCGYVRLPHEEGRAFHEFISTTPDGDASQGESLYHCDECKDEEEFEYV